MIDQLILACLVSSLQLSFWYFLMCSSFMYCLQLSNLFYLEFKLPGNIYLVQSVYHHCTPELKIVSGTEEAIRWLTEWRRKGMDFEVSAEYQGFFYCSDCCDYPLRNTLRWLIIVPSLHEKFGLWLELVSFPSFQFMVFGSFRWKTFFFSHQTDSYTDTQILETKD